jgi:hypothetical protein
MVKANKIPAETKSSRAAKGTNVANSVIKTPANTAPFFRSPNHSGIKPSLAIANCNLGWMMIEINTTTGKVATSPAAVIVMFG